MTERNAARNGLTLETLCVSWTAPEPLLARAPWDLVLASDVLYEARNGDALLPLLPRLGGEIWLADPGRPAAGAVPGARGGVVRDRDAGARPRSRRAACIGCGCDEHTAREGRGAAPPACGARAVGAGERVGRGERAGRRGGARLPRDRDRELVDRRRARVPGRRGDLARGDAGGGRAGGVRRRAAGHRRPRARLRRRERDRRGRDRGRRGRLQPRGLDRHRRAVAGRGARRGRGGRAGRGRDRRRADRDQRAHRRVPAKAPAASTRRSSAAAPTWRRAPTHLRPGRPRRADAGGARRRHRPDQRVRDARRPDAGGVRRASASPA